MANMRREFSPEFEREAVALARRAAAGRRCGSWPSQTFGLRGSRSWRPIQNGVPPRGRAMPAWGLAALTGPATFPPADLASETAELRRELDRTRMERDILNEVIDIFAELPK